MFGYVVANSEKLTEENRDIYKAYYCGLCRSLRKNYSTTSSAIISYDMVFLVLVLSSLYEPEEERGDERCIAHPMKTHRYIINKYTDYAAEMNILLAYHKALDDWNDEKKVSAKALALALKKDSQKIEEKYPRQAEAIISCLSRLSKLENERVQDPDAAAQCFGELMRELFIYYEDNWKKTLGDMADNLGQYIYILDAFVDLKGDIKHNRYNPLTEMVEKGASEMEIEAILTMLIGECSQKFENLPLIENIDIMRNIIYSGVWAKFALGIDKKKGDRGETANDK